MRFTKLISKIFLILIILLSYDLIEVRAEGSNSAPICVDGYQYYFTKQDELYYNFDQLNGTKLTDLTPNGNVPSSGKYTKNGVELLYNLYGIYNNDFNSSCYTYFNYNGDISYSSSVKDCGEKYNKDDLAFEIHTLEENHIGKNIKPGYTDEEIKEYNQDYASNTINSNGTISLKIKLAKNEDESTLADVWNRIYVSRIEYDGGTLKGTCERNGNSINCDGISPYQPKKDESTKRLTNTSQYRIYLSLRGINRGDFDELVDDATKDGYVESCGGTDGSIYLGSISTNIIGQDVLALDNPIGNDTEQGRQVASLCEKVNNLEVVNQNLKEAYVEECYNPKLSYIQYTDQVKLITNKLENLEDMYSGVYERKGLAVEENLLCTDMRLGIPSTNTTTIPFETKIVYEDTDGYWGAVCVEEYYVDGGQPSLVKAGTGVNYYNKVQINRSCSIILLDKVTMKPECQTFSSCETRYDHGNDGKFNDGDIDGGPTQGFDSCVESCDGGKYTQSCINSCYHLNYSDNRTELLSKVSQSSFDFSSNYNIVKIGDLTSDDAALGGDAFPKVNNSALIPGTNNWTIESKKVSSFSDPRNGYNCAGSCIVNTIRDENGNVVSESGTTSGCGATPSVFCSSWTGPDGCVDNPGQTYVDEIDDLIDEYKKLVTKLEHDSKLEQYSISFTDSYTGNIYKVTGNSEGTNNSIPQLIITKDGELSNISSEEQIYTIGSEGDTMEGKKKLNVTTVYNVELPLAHVKVDDAELIVVENPNTTSNEDKYYSYSIKNNSNEYSFENYSSYNSALFTKGQNVFYTSLNSPNYNLLVNSGKNEEELSKVSYFKVTINDKTDIYELINNSENIEVNLQVGNPEEDGFKSFEVSGLKCYYGVYNFLKGRPGGGDNPDPTPTPTGGGNSSTGLRYYYREIYLNKDNGQFGGIFNDRKPRWNWTGTIKNDKATGAASNSDPSYIVDPENLIKDIEDKGDKIFTDEYSSEIDYQFTMTRDIINKIREYNDGENDDGTKRTYLDFSLVATSKDKPNYSKMITEWYPELNSNYLFNISGCNNATDKKC